MVPPAAERLAFGSGVVWCIVSGGYADHRSAQGLSRHRHRQRSVRWHGCLEPDPSGCAGPAPRCRGSLRSKELLDARSTVAGPGARGARRASASVLSRPDRAALSHSRRPAVLADARMGARWKDERLGPGEPALFADGLQGGGAGRVGDSVADLIRRRGSVLRPGRAVDRCVRRLGRLGRAPGQQVPAACTRPAMRRAAPAEGHAQAGHSCRGRAPSQPNAAARAASRRVTIAATAAPAATPHRSSVPPITCCPPR